jgi:hypothetical protein
VNQRRHFTKRVRIVRIDGPAAVASTDIDDLNFIGNADLLQQKNEAR